MGGEFGYGLATDTDTRLEEASTGRSALEAYLSISSLCDGSRHLSQAFFASGVEIYMMHPSGGEITPSNSGSSRTEDSFGIQVLMEPFSETEMGGTSDKAKGAYWADIKLELDHAPSQREYNRLLEFENRDLHIREKKTESFRLFQAVLERNPTLADQAPYNPQEAFNDFLDQHRDRLDHRELEVDVGERDKAEIAFLNIVIKGLKENGASYVRRIFQ
ncbi:hypothetical protein L2E82_53360 [Cichorium intybus]|nr:hypothetical protein L2E82_53360 [Cichorium intybus]